jgi:DNA primase
MKHEQLSYFDALRVLAKKYNIDIQERELTDAEKQVKNDRESMLIVNSFAQKYFSSMLYEHMEGKNIGLRYFAERGFREDIIRKFQLGYSLEQRDALFLEATKSGYRKEFLEKTGLVIAYDNGSVADRFRGRVIFPVHTLSGKVVAFGGRVLKKDEKTAKYMNSPESEIYHKSNELYGIYFAKQAIVKADRCFLVEGYTDVISMHQAGIENVVASSGTALTQGQIRLIHRFTNNITVLYDGDAAGIKAALRGIDLLLEEGMNIKVVLLPDGEDPDSFARKQNATQFGEFIQEHETDFIRFKTRLLLDDAGGDPIKRSNLISDIVRTVAIIPDNIARSVYIRECSSMLEIDERVLLNEVNNLKLSKDEKRGGVAPVQDVPVTAIPDYPPLPEYMDEAFPPDAPAFPPEDYRPEEADVQMQQQPVVPPKRVLSSPYEVYEIALLRYVVRYGECVLYDYVDTESGQQVIIKVAQYIKYSLEEDDLSFMNPLFKKMLEATAEGCATEGFIASRYFLSHSDQVISRLAANLLSDKYHLSKYHTKYRELEEEKDRLEQVVLRDLYGLKDAYIHQRIKDVQTKIKEAQIERNMDKTMELMQELTKLNEIKSVLSKEIGERIILKM